MIQTGAVTIGRDVFIGDKTVLDINTSMGDGAQLGHTSTLAQRWDGAGRRTMARIPGATHARWTTCGCRQHECGTLRRTSAVILTLLNVFFIVMPMAEGGLELVLSAMPSLSAVAGSTTNGIGSQQFYLDALVLSAALFGGCLLLGLLLVITVPRLLNLAIVPERVYPLYGFHYGVTRRSPASPTSSSSRSSSGTARISFTICAAWAISSFRVRADRVQLR